MSDTDRIADTVDNVETADSADVVNGVQDETGTETAPADTVTDGSYLGDRILALATIALGAGLLFAAFGFPAPAQSEDPGTAALPRLIGVALVVLGGLLLFNCEKNIYLPEPGSRLRVVLIVVASIAYALLLTPLGFVLSSLVFMVVALLIMGVRSVLRLVLVPILVTFIVYYLFTEALGVYLPEGIIEGILP